MNALVLPGPNCTMSLYREGREVVLVLVSASPATTTCNRFSLKAAVQIRDALTVMLEAEP